MPPVLPSRGSVLTRMIMWVLAKRRGEVGALRDLEAVQGTLQLTGLFAITVIAPAILLSYFALNSLRAEEVAVDVDVGRRAEQVAARVYQDLEVSITRFEQAAVKRLLDGQPVTAGLADLSPFLLAAFRVDASGQVSAPFSLPEPLAERPPSPHYLELMADAGQAERNGDALRAAELYQRAVSAAEDLSYAGEAAFAHARSLIGAQRIDAAEEALANVLSDYGPVRDRNGVRIGDLATLTLAELRVSRQPDVGGVVLRDIIERVLADRWVIGRPGEAAVARRALRMVEGRVDEDWIASARERVAERSRQLFWAERLADELGLIVEASRSDQQGFRYYARPGSNSLWATLWWKGELRAFAFDYTRIVTALRESATAASALDDDVTARISGPGGTPDALASRPLVPWLSLAVLVTAEDPDALQRRKAVARRLRLIVIFVAVGMSVFGVVFSSLLVGQELESARMKADFAANVSHELRSPITQIRLKGESLQFGLVRNDEDAQEHYDAIVREAERLSRLVDNVLDFAAIERGAKSYTFRPDDLGEIAHAALTSSWDGLREAGVEIEVDIPMGLPVTWIDREAISQVLTNLLSNVAKYGRDGGWVGVTVRERGDYVEVLVADRGRGIPVEDQARIFDRFYRSSDVEVRSRRGTGIGLTIVRYIVDAHRGTIAVDSEPGRGTTFTVSLPTTPPPSS